MRRAISVIFIVLGCVAAPLALVGLWATSELGDTDRYVTAVTPLAGDRAVQEVVADRVTAVTTKPLRELDASLSGDVIRGPVDSVVVGDRFPPVWERINRVAHRHLSAVLSGQGFRASAAGDGTVSLDLTAVYEAARRVMVESGVVVAARLPDLHPRIELFSTAALVRARAVYTWLTRLKWVLPILSAVLLVAGALVARDRWRASIGVGLGLAAGMVVLAVVLVVVRDVSLPGLAGNDGAWTAAATAVFDALTRSLWIGLRVLFVVGLILAGVAFVARHRRLSRTGTGSPGTGSP
ncbi:hypothetical protein [Streptosporangium sp. NPDC051022]|uniref:hypothetical protein n=1 Tax=Streptosporangium sp. NPDC051022 TaxID=3155752 RepID=UPI00343C9F0B